MSFLSLNAWAVKILSGAYISNPLPPKINLKHDRAMRKGKEEPLGRSKDGEYFFSLGQT